MATLAQDIAVYQNIPAAQRTAKQSAALATDIATQRRQTATATPTTGTKTPTTSDATDPTWGVVSGLGASDLQAKLVAAGTQVWTAPGVTAPAPGVTAAEAASAALTMAGLSPEQPTPYYDPSSKQFFVEPAGNAAGLNPAGTPQQLAAAAEKVSGAATPEAAQTAYSASLAPTAPTSTSGTPSIDASAIPGLSGGSATAATNNAQPDLSGNVGAGGSTDAGGGSAPSGSILSSLSTTDYLLIAGLALTAFAVMHHKKVPA